MWVGDGQHLGHLVKERNTFLRMATRLPPKTGVSLMRGDGIGVEGARDGERKMPVESRRQRCPGKKKKRNKEVARAILRQNNLGILV